MSTSFSETLTADLLHYGIVLDVEAVLEMLSFSVGYTPEERQAPRDLTRNRLTYESLQTPWAKACFGKVSNVEYFLEMLSKNFRNSDNSRAFQTAVIRACEENCNWFFDDNSAWISKHANGTGGVDYLIKHVVPAVEDRLSSGQCGLMLEDMNDANAEAFASSAFGEFQDIFLLPKAKKRYLAVCTITTTIARIARWRVIDEHRKWRKLQAKLEMDRKQWERELESKHAPQKPVNEEPRVAELVLHFQNGLGDELPEAGVVGDWTGELDTPPSCLKGRRPASLKYLILYHWYGFPQALIAREHGKSRTAVHLSLKKSWKDALKPWIESKIDG